MTGKLSRTTTYVNITPSDGHACMHACMQTKDGEGQCDVVWWFGEGLSYTTFEYTALKVEPRSIHDGQAFRVGPNLEKEIKDLRSRAENPTVNLPSKIA